MAWNGRPSVGVGICDEQSKKWRGCIRKVCEHLLLRIALNIDEPDVPQLERIERRRARCAAGNSPRESSVSSGSINSVTGVSLDLANISGNREEEARWKKGKCDQTSAQSIAVSRHVLQTDVSWMCSDQEQRRSSESA